MPMLRFVASTHAYYLQGERLSSVTALAKRMQNSWALEQWSKRQVAIGLGARPDLVHLVQSLAGSDSKDANAALDSVCEQAHEAAAASAQANTGTAIHTVLERRDKGEEFIPADPAMAQLQSDYSTALEIAGLRAVPHLVERIVVMPEHGLAGTFDRGYLTDGGALMLGDVKSGQRAIRYPHSMAAQMGLYSMAESMYEPATDTMVEPPKWGNLAVIAHTPITGGVELWSMPLDLCREAAEHALWLHHWVRRAPGDIIQQWVIPPVKALAESATESPSVQCAQPAHKAAPPTASTDTQGSEGRASLTQPADAFDGLVDGFVAAPAAPERRAWVINRMQSLLMHDSNALKQVAAMWPAGLATFKASDAHTDADLDRICAVLDQVETLTAAPFPEPDPAAPSAPTDSSERVFWSAPDEGPAVGDQETSAIAKRYKGLAPAAARAVMQWSTEATTADRPFTLRELASVRRFEITRAAIALAEACMTGVDDGTGAEVVRTMVGMVRPMAPGMTIGKALGSLSCPEAVALTNAAHLFADGELVLSFSADGKPSLQWPADKTTQ